MAKFDIEPQYNLTGPADETYTARRGRTRNKAMKKAKGAKAQLKKFGGFEGGFEDVQQDAQEGLQDAPEAPAEPKPGTPEPSPGKPSQG